MNHRHQGPGNWNQRCQAQVHRQHAERLFEPERPGKVVPDRLVARRGRPEQHDKSLAHHRGHEQEERKAEDHAQHGAPPHVRFAAQDLWVRGTVWREGTALTRRPQAPATVRASRPRLKSPTEQPAGPRQPALQGFPTCFGPWRRSAPGPTASSPWSRPHIAQPRHRRGAGCLAGFGERRLPKFGQGSIRSAQVWTAGPATRSTRTAAVKPGSR